MTTAKTPVTQEDIDRIIDMLSDNTDAIISAANPMGYLRSKLTNLLDHIEGSHIYAQKCSEQLQKIKTEEADATVNVFMIMQPGNGRVILHDAPPFIDAYAPGSTSHKALTEAFPQADLIEVKNFNGYCATIHIRIPVIQMNNSVADVQRQLSDILWKIYNPDFTTLTCVSWYGRPADEEFIITVIDREGQVATYVAPVPAWNVIDQLDYDAEEMVAIIGTIKDAEDFTEPFRHDDISVVSIEINRFRDAQE